MPTAVSGTKLGNNVGVQFSWVSVEPALVFWMVGL